MSPKTLIIAAAALAASAVTTLPASAAEGPGQPGKDRPLPLRAAIMFNLVDTNGDGSVDQAELAALQKAIFTAIDADKDGKLSKDEFGRLTAGPRGDGAGRQRFGRGPGGQGPGFFHRGLGGPGPDRQGQLDGQQMPGPNSGPDRGTMPPLGDNQDGAPPDAFAQPRDFASLDTNGDGVVTADEFAAGAPQFPLPR